MKRCYVCKKLKDGCKFKKDKSGINGLANICKKCHSIKSYEDRRAHPEKIAKQYLKTKKWQDANPDFKIFQAAKRRAKQAGIPFTITRKDIVIPTHCPVFGIPLIVGGQRYATANSPSLDKIIPALGYVPGNVVVISHKANTMKSNATLDELESLVKWLRGHVDPVGALFAA